MNRVQYTQILHIWFEFNGLAELCLRRQGHRLVAEKTSLKHLPLGFGILYLLIKFLGILLRHQEGVALGGLEKAF